MFSDEQAYCPKDANTVSLVEQQYPVSISASNLVGQRAQKTDVTVTLKAQMDDAVLGMTYAYRRIRFVVFNNPPVFDP